MHGNFFHSAKDAFWLGVSVGFVFFGAFYLFMTKVVPHIYIYWK